MHSRPCPDLNLRPHERGAVTVAPFPHSPAVEKSERTECPIVALMQYTDIVGLHATRYTVRIIET